MSFTYPYEQAAHTVDAVVFGVDFKDNTLKVLLILRGREGEPFCGHWALPGGYVDIGDRETTLQAVHRELGEETGLTASYMEQLATFDDPDRDPRGRVISTAHMALIKTAEVKGADDAKEAMWFPVDRLPPLAFDHDKIIATGLKRLKAKIRWHPIGIEFLPEQFTLSELQRLYEIVLARPIDKRNFRKKILAYGVLKKAGVAGPYGARTYQFDRDAYARMSDVGVYFEV